MAPTHHAFYDIAPESRYGAVSHTHTHKVRIPHFAGRESDAHVFQLKSRILSSKISFSFPQLHKRLAEKDPIYWYVPPKAIWFYCGCSVIFLYDRKSQIDASHVAFDENASRYHVWRIFSLIQNRLPAHRRRGLKSHMSWQMHLAGGESVLKDFLFSAGSASRWWWRVSSHEWLLTHAHMHTRGACRYISP